MSKKNLNLKKKISSLFFTKIIPFCGRVQSEPSHDKFLRRLSVSVRVNFCEFLIRIISDGDDSVEEELIDNFL